MDELRYQVDLLGAMNHKLEKEERMFRLVCDTSSNAFLYVNFEEDSIKTLANWNFFFPDTEIRNMKDIAKLYSKVEDRYLLLFKELLNLEKTGMKSNSGVVRLLDGKTWIECEVSVIYDEILEILNSKYHLTEEEAMNHPQRNVISKDLGSSFLENSGNNYLEVETFPLIPQSLLLLCSDGLNDMLTSLQIVTELENGKTVQEKVDLLIKAANDIGGKDNITVVIVESRLQDDNASVAENELIEHFVMDDFAEGQIAESNNRKNLVEHILVICAVLIFVVGYTLGGCTGNVIFPSLFSEGGDKDAQTISRLDSLIIDLKNDTTELKHTINEQESLIIALKDSLRRK